MNTIETLIPDNKGNHLVVVLYFYDEIDKRHTFHIPEEYRWKLFEALYHRSLKRLQSLDINSISIIVGPEGYQADARIFYRPRHSSIVHIVESHLKNKYR